MLTAC